MAGVNKSFFIQGVSFLYMVFSVNTTELKEAHVYVQVCMKRLSVCALNGIL